MSQDLAPRTPTGVPSRWVRLVVAGAAMAGMIAGASGAAWATSRFNDVPANHPFFDEITWMADTGISTGYDDGTYRPGDPVTRQAMSAFMQRLYSLRDTYTATSSDYAELLDVEGGVWTDVPEMSRTVTVPEGTTATIVARYNASSLCTDDESIGTCEVRITVDGSPAGKPALLASLSGSTSQGWLGQSYERWVTGVSPGDHTVKVQGGGSMSDFFQLVDQTLSVQVILQPATG